MKNLFTDSSPMAVCSGVCGCPGFASRCPGGCVLCAYHAYVCTCSTHSLDPWKPVPVVSGAHERLSMPYRATSSSPSLGTFAALLQLVHRLEDGSTLYARVTPLEHLDSVRLLEFTRKRPCLGGTIGKSGPSSAATSRKAVRSAVTHPVIGFSAGGSQSVALAAIVSEAGVVIVF